MVTATNQRTIVITTAMATAGFALATVHKSLTPTLRSLTTVVPPGEVCSNKTELQLVQEDIQRLKDEIERKESRLKLAKLQEEIKQIGSKLREKEELARNRQVNDAYTH